MGALRKSSRSLSHLLMSSCLQMVDDGGRRWLVRMEWRPAGWSVCLSRTIKSRSSLLAPAHPGGPGIRVKRLWCGGGFYKKICNLAWTLLSTASYYSNYVHDCLQCVVLQTEIRHPVNGLFSRTTWVSRRQKGKTYLDFIEARDDGVAVASAGRYVNHLHLASDR